MRFRRPIPRLAQVSLVLGACGDGAGGPGADPSDIASSYEGLCTRLALCDPEAFAEYSSFDACVQSQANYFAEFEYYFGTECLEAYARRSACFLDSFGRSCDVDADAFARDCRMELDDVDALCALAY
ncbi:MAG: hypothetical protein AAF447_04285 [Myxococcota bacterium]